MKTFSYSYKKLNKKHKIVIVLKVGSENWAKVLAFLNVIQCLAILIFRKLNGRL